MKVYVVTEWNGEQWEDSYEWVDKIFKNKEQAKNYVKNRNEVEQKRKIKMYDWDEKHQWSMKEYNIEPEIDLSELKENYIPMMEVER